MSKRDEVIQQLKGSGLVDYLRSMRAIAHESKTNTTVNGENIYNHQILDEVIRRLSSPALSGGEESDAKTYTVNSEFCPKILALLIAAPAHQGGHGLSGQMIAKALEIDFPISMDNLEIRAKQLGYDTNELWPWLYEMRRKEPPQ